MVRRRLVLASLAVALLVAELLVTGSAASPGVRPRAQAAPADAEPGILTPAAPREPRINGPTVSGVRPGHPFLYRIPATGDRPMRFGASGLPRGLRLDPATGIISGTVASLEKRSYETALVAGNARGRAQRGLRIVVGDTLALTPPMGWNDWYTFCEHPSDALMRRAADLMVESGLADHGADTVSLYGRGTIFGFPQTAYKEWQLADGTPVLVPVDFNIAARTRFGGLGTDLWGRSREGLAAVRRAATPRAARDEVRGGAPLPPPSLPAGALGELRQHVPGRDRDNFLRVGRAPGIQPLHLLIHRDRR
jgi:hypothetical protein